jgi:hypothetical protein
MGLKHSVHKKANNDTINWNDIKTENMSSDINSKYLSKQANELLTQLKLDLLELSENESEHEVDVNRILKNITNNKYSTNINLSEDLNNSSPFITNEMYNELLNSTTSDDMIGQRGGVNKKTALKGGAVKEESSTSSTSDSSKEKERL